jgi:hypothetical protein
MLRLELVKVLEGRREAALNASVQEYERGKLLVPHATRNRFEPELAFAGCMLKEHATAQQAHGGALSNIPQGWEGGLRQVDVDDAR